MWWSWVYGGASQRPCARWRPCKGIGAGVSWWLCWARHVALSPFPPTHCQPSCPCVHSFAWGSVPYVVWCEACREWFSLFGVMRNVDRLLPRA